MQISFPGTLRKWNAIACVALCAAVVFFEALGAQPRSPVIQDRVRLDPSQPVDFHVLITPDTVYVGQQATYEMGVFITESAQMRMRRNPEVVPAELRGVLAYDLGGPQSLPAITQNGVRTYPHVLQRALFPLSSGRITIPASQLTYALPRSSSYFSREESAVVRADEVSVFAKPLPTEGQPARFSGAVGVITVQSRIDAPSARVGEPVVLTVRVGGRGNVKLWPRPRVTAPDASVVSAGERVRVDTSGQYVRGTKEFDWLITPDREGRLVIPVVQYPHFDPYGEEYRIASTDSVTLPVMPGSIAPVADADDEVELLSIRRTDRGSLRGSLSSEPLLWALMALVPIPAFWVRRRRVRHAQALQTSSDSGESAELHTAPDLHIQRAQSDPVRIAASSLRHSFLNDLAERLGSAASVLVERKLLQARLRRRGVTRETTADVMQLLAELDEAAWSSAGASGSTGTGSPSWAERIRNLAARVDAEAIPVRSSKVQTGRRGSRGSRGGIPLIWMLVSSAVLFGAATALHANSAQFDRAVSLYDSGAFSDASVEFLELAERAPRNADAWANGGTAAWAAHDTASAVIGWQRALRLEPMAGDLRDRMQLLPQESQSGIASVPRIPRDLPFLIAVVLWCAGWVVIAAVAMRSPRTVAPQGVAALALAVAAGIWHIAADSRLEGSRLGVVETREAIRVSPAADANANGDTSPGDVVAVGEQHVDASRGEIWIAVQHVDGRLGWMPAQSLYLFGSDGTR